MSINPPPRSYDLFSLKSWTQKKKSFKLKLKLEKPKEPEKIAKYKD